MLSVGRGSRLARWRDCAYVARKVFSAGNIGRMGQHQPDRNAEWFVKQPGPFLHAELVEASDGDGGDFFVVHLVAALARA